MTEKEEYLLYIENLYEEYVQRTEKRGISYGELIYIQNLNKKQLQEMEKELYKQLNKTIQD